MKSIILSLFLLTSFFKANSQDIVTQTVSWASVSTRNVTTNTVTSETTTLISNIDGGLVWKNADGTYRKNFRIIEVIGEWQNVQTDGRIQYEVTDGHASGTIAFKRTSNQTLIRIAMESQPPETVELTINGITEIQN